MAQDTRHDPFGDEAFLREVAAFETPAPRRQPHRPSVADVAKIAQASGFDQRTAVAKPVKEPLKPLQFRLQASEVQAFRQRAYQEFGPGQGAIIALFRKIWQDYCEANPSEHA